MPRSSIRNGYSLVPWLEPRYLRIRSRRVAICPATRLSSRITQSATYSSRPWRVRPVSPRSAVMIAVTPLVFSQRKRRRNSARRIAVLVSPEKSASMVSITTRLAPMPSIACSSRMNSPPRSYSPVSSISLRSTWTKSIASFFCATSACRSYPSEAKFVASSSACSSKATKTPGSPNSFAPRDRNSMASSVLPHPAPPHSSVGRPWGRPPPVS